MFGRGVILRVDGEREGLDGARLQRANLFRMRLLAFQPAQVLTIRPENYIHQGQHEDRNLPTRAPVDDMQDLGYACADHVIRERPEITGPPDVTERFVL